MAEPIICIIFALRQLTRNTYMMKKAFAIFCLLTATLGVNAQWSQRIVVADAEKGTPSTSMITYEDSIGYLYFDEGMNDVFYIGNNQSIEFAVNKSAKVKKVIAKIDCYDENNQLLETYDGYQLIAKDEYITLYSDKLDKRGASQRKTTKNIIDFALNNAGYIRFIIPMADNQTFDFKIPCKRIC